MFSPADDHLKPAAEIAAGEVRLPWVKLVLWRPSLLLQRLRGVDRAGRRPAASSAARARSRCWLIRQTTAACASRGSPSPSPDGGVRTSACARLVGGDRVGDPRAGRRRETRAPGSRSPMRRERRDPGTTASSSSAPVPSPTERAKPVLHPVEDRIGSRVAKPNFRVLAQVFYPRSVQNPSCVGKAATPTA